MREFKVGDRVRSDEYREHKGRDLWIVGVGCGGTFYCSPNKLLHPKHKANGSFCYYASHLTHAEPVPIGYTGKLKDMDLQAGDVVKYQGEEYAFQNVIPYGSVYDGEYDFYDAIMELDGVATLISRATGNAADTAPTWSDWMLSRKDGTITQQYAEAETVPLDDTDQVVYRGRDVIVKFAIGDDVYSVTLKDGVPDWSTVVHINGEG